MTDKKVKKILESIVIIIDTQEKKNSHIRMWLKKNKISYIKQSLKFGDYSFMIPKNIELGIKEDIYFFDEIVIERKNSLEEISGNFTTGRKRFKREFERARDKKCDVRIMIESSKYDDIQKHNYDTKLSPTSMSGSLHGFDCEYNLPFIFVEKESAGHFIYNRFYYWLRNKLEK